MACSTNCAPPRCRSSWKSTAAPARFLRAQEKVEERANRESIIDNHAHLKELFGP